MENAPAPDRLTLDYPDAELVFGVVCAVGTDYRRVVAYLSNLLKRAKYVPKEFHVSESFPEIASRLELDLEFPDNSHYAHIDSRIKAGNAIRRKTEENGFLALDIISRIYSTREGAETDNPAALPHVAHIIVSLKRKEEVDVLRKIYGPGFFLIGIFASEQERRDYLETEKGIRGEPLAELIERDQQESNEEFGQRTSKTFEHADVFVALKADQYKKGLERFLRLVFGYPYATPRKDEHGMFLAYAASARSGALARQVGAAILSADGDLLAVGCNDVPRPGGGLYSDDDGDHDHRDWALGGDANDEEKREIVTLAEKKFKTLHDNDSNFEPRILEKFRTAVAGAVSDITEFGRDVHAEMDAITTCARIGVAVKGANLFTTTFPCHNCTRHIVAAGISRVVYIEPYPKSKAGKLHGDAVCFTEDKDSRDQRIPLVPFVGIGPRRFFDLFSLNLSTGYPIERKVGGEVIGWSFEDNAKPRVPLPPTSYMDREQLVSQNIVSIYNAYDSKSSTKTKGSQEGARLLAIDADDGLASSKVAPMESGREVGKNPRTGTDDKNGGKLFG
jgi:deoxycytidylate deaminase